MKRVAIIFSLLLIAGSVSFAQKQTPQEANASKIISMTNDVIEMYNKYTANLKKVREGLQKSVENRERLGDNPQSSGYGFNCNNFTISEYDVAAYEKAVKAAPTFPEKAKIQEAVAFVIGNNEEFAKRCSELSDYFNQKKHLEDTSFTQYQELFDSLNDMYSQISDAWRTATSLASDAGDRSEILFLKKSPIAEFIIPMKEDISRAKRLLDKFYEDEPDFASIKADIAEIAKEAEKNRSMEGKKAANLEKYSYPSYHTSFYQYIDDLVKNATKLEDLLNPETPEEDWHEDRVNNTLYGLNSNYRGMIQSYNEM